MLISVRDNDCKSKFRETKVQTNLTTNSSRFETLNTPQREPTYQEPKLPINFDRQSPQKLKYKTYKPILSNRNRASPIIAMTFREKFDEPF